MNPLLNATFNYLSSLECAFYLPTFIFLCPSSEKPSCHQCPFIYSSLITYRISTHLSRFRSNTPTPCGLFRSLKSEIASLSLNVRVFSIHCSHVALTTFYLTSFLFIYLNYLFLRLETHCGKRW